ncbi:hypothetical protein WICMUC_004461 [Wickerhamomyces mucosus]|uniref:mRNA cap guanine-N(7) methyltransferase n=1 Tax=Wickerhamomyces mucosus TaxID=1378264 RepID=A0A9P8PI44_9ASCO|nr:hypothetical protein WICMUC_004461 [Wickerhamomyces mucosus]
MSEETSVLPSEDRIVERKEIVEKKQQINTEDNLGDKNDDIHHTEQIQPSKTSSDQTTERNLALKTPEFRIKKRALESHTGSSYSPRNRDRQNNLSRRHTPEEPPREDKSSDYQPQYQSQMYERNQKQTFHPDRQRNEPPAKYPKYNQLHSNVDEIIVKKNANLDSTVISHYNKRTYDSRKSARSQSPIIKLRHFNNAIKYMLINKYTKPGYRVLDLGCGKGGDISKWEMAGIREYIGIDISDESIKEAVKRYRRHKPSFAVTFVTGDGFGAPLPHVLRDFPHLNLSVDVVSMQFCLHYGFESEIKARMMIENVARSLRPEGIFIGTIPNSDFLMFKMKRLPPGEKAFGNSLYRVTFLKNPPSDGHFDNPYGNVYNYFLEDAIDNVPEFVVPFEALRALAEEYGLKLIYKKTFNEMFAEEIPKWYNKLNPKIIEGMRRTKDGGVGVEGDESDATANFYIAFAFIKA